MSKMLKTICKKLRHLAVCESGQDLAEYGLLVTVLALACISGMQGPANSVNQIFGQISTALAPPQTNGGQGDTGGGGNQGGGGDRGGRGRGGHGGDGGGGGHHGGGGGRHFGF
jgi:Flp pilus assembly pilin Flp